MRLRDRYQLSQRALAALLGWGVITIQRYESGGIQDCTRSNTSVAGRSGELRRCLHGPNCHLSPSQIERLQRTLGTRQHTPNWGRAIEDVISEMSVVDIMRGFRCLDMERLEPPHGPIPHNFTLFLGLMESDGTIRLDDRDPQSNVIEPHRPYDDALSSPSELTTLKAIAEHFGPKLATELSNQSYREASWANRGDGELFIPYTEEESTIYKESHSASQFLFSLQELGGNHLAEVTEDMLVSLFIAPDGRRLKGHTYRQSASVVLQAGISLDPAACRRVSALLPETRNARKNIPYLTPEEVQKIRMVQYADAGRPGQLALYTGLRGCDIAAMQWPRWCIQCRNQNGAGAAEQTNPATRKKSAVVSHCKSELRLPVSTNISIPVLMPRDRLMSVRAGLHYLQTRNVHYAREVDFIDEVFEDLLAQGRFVSTVHQGRVIYRTR